MSIISVTKLKKHFKVFKRREGLMPTLRSLFHRPASVVKAVDDISFTISKGELVGFIGPNGAGKTTTLKCLSGLLYPTGGKVSVLGFNPYDRKSAYLKQISLVMGQKSQLWWDLPAIETFRLNKEIYDLNQSDYKHHLDSLINLLEVKDFINIPVRQLSLGQRMKMELIAALVHHPKVLFLDEPTIGLDVVMQRKMRDFISSYNRRFQATMLLTSHYMADVRHLCKRVIIINQGKLVYDGTLDKLSEKYANYKIISVRFKKQENLDNLAKIASIKTTGDRKIVMTIPKSMTNKIASELLDDYKIEDLNIEEPELENLIRTIFTKK